MTLTVAIASECDPFDGEIYRHVTEALLGRPVQKWIGTSKFDGCRAVAKLAPAFLAAAAKAGVRHALLAVDNDGGGRRRPEHADTDVPVAFDIDDDQTCRECWLLQAVPSDWPTLGGQTCVVAPVQAIETWLLVL